MDFTYLKLITRHLKLSNNEKRNSTSDLPGKQRSAFCTGENVYPHQWEYAGAPISNIDSVYFGNHSETVLITYNGNSATFVDPLTFEGVSISVEDADVVVNSTLDDQKVDYELTGSISDEMFKFYGDYKFNFILNGVDITNEDGPAINIQTGKKCDLTLEDGTENSLNDGRSYADSDEDQKAALFSKAKLFSRETAHPTTHLIQQKEMVEKVTTVTF